MPPKVSKRAARTWDRLRQWYGARVAEQYGELPPPDWCALIDRTDDERLESAMSRVRHASPIHPPTLGQLEDAIPRRARAGEATLAERLCDAAARKFGPALCQHQLLGPWNYFGPVKEYVCANRADEIVTHPEVRGVQIPQCAKCSKPSHRMLANEATAPWVPKQIDSAEDRADWLQSMRDLVAEAKVRRPNVPRETIDPVE